VTIAGFSAGALLDDPDGDMLEDIFNNTG